MAIRLGNKKLLEDLLGSLVDLIPRETQPTPTPIPEPSPTPEPIMSNPLAELARGKFGDEGVRVLNAILRTEGWGGPQSIGDRGDPRSAIGAHGPLQFFGGRPESPGVLNTFAKEMGITLPAAASNVSSNPENAVQWALAGYLGKAMKAGMDQGLLGPELATFVQKYGQRSNFPERAGKNYVKLPGLGEGQPPIPTTPHPPVTVGEGTIGPAKPKTIPTLLDIIKNIGNKVAPDPHLSEYGAGPDGTIPGLIKAALENYWNSDPNAYYENPIEQALMTPMPILGTAKGAAGAGKAAAKIAPDVLPALEGAASKVSEGYALVSKFGQWFYEKTGLTKIIGEGQTKEYLDILAKRIIQGKEPLSGNESRRLFQEYKAETLAKKATEIPQEVAQVTQPTVAPEVRTGTANVITPTGTLPRDLAGAKPRYNIGTTSYNPIFSNDVDKALYIVAQTKKSKRDDGYMAWLRGLYPDSSDADIRSLGSRVREGIKSLAKLQPEGGDLHVMEPRAGSPINVGRLAAELGRVPTKPLERQQVPTNAEATPNLVSPTKATGRRKAFQESGGVPPNKPPTGINLEGPSSIPPGGLPPSNVPPNIGTQSSFSGMEPPKVPNWHKFLDTAGDLINIPRAFKFAFDISERLRQSYPMVFLAPKSWARGVVPTVKSIVSEKAAIEANDKIIKNKYYPLAKELGLDLMSLGKKPPVGSAPIDKSALAEEFVSAELAGKVPVLGRGVEVSNRSFVTGSNVTRWDAMYTTMETLERAGLDIYRDSGIRKELQEWGLFLNAVSGRGNLREAITAVSTGKVDAPAARGIVAGLNLVLNAARFQFSRPEALFRAGKIVVEAPHLRGQAVRGLLGIVASYVATRQVIAHALGGTVEGDPASSDFWKPRIGNLSIDDSLGFLPWFRMIYQIATERGKSLDKGKKFERTASDTLEAFAKNRLNPLWQGIGTGLQGYEGLTGRPLNEMRLLGLKNIPGTTTPIPWPIRYGWEQFLAPVSPSDVSNILSDKDLPSGIKVIASLLNELGIGTSNFNPIQQEQQRRVWDKNRLREKNQRLGITR